MVDDRAQLRGDMMQNVHKPSKPQVRDFPPPQGFHALEVERFQRDMVVLGTQITRQLPPTSFQPACVSVKGAKPPAPTQSRQRFGITDLAKGRRANTLSGLASLSISHVLEEALIPLVDALHNVLHRLRAKLRPPVIFWQLLQLGEVGFQPVRRQMCLVSSVIPLMQDNTVVMNDTTNIDLMVQSSIAF
jgi:hypothetical protein